MNSPSQQALTQQQAFTAWQRLLADQQRQAEGQAQTQQNYLRYLETAGLPSSALQEALNNLIQALQSAAAAAWRAGDAPAYWLRQREITQETTHLAQKASKEEQQAAAEAVKFSRAQLEYAEAAHLPRQFRETLKDQLAQALQEAAQTALRQGDAALFWRREAELARLQQQPDPFALRTRRIAGGPSGSEGAFQPLQFQKVLGPEPRDLALPSSLKPQAPTLTVRIELTEGLKAKIVEQSSLSSLQVLTRILEGMG